MSISHGLAVYLLAQQLTSLVAGTIVTFYGGEVKNEIEMFAAFGSEFAPAGPNVASYSPRHTIDCGKEIEFRAAQPLPLSIDLCV